VPLAAEHTFTPIEGHEGRTCDVMWEIPRAGDPVLYGGRRYAGGECTVDLGREVGLNVSVFRRG